MVEFLAETNARKPVPPPPGICVDVAVTVEVLVDVGPGVGFIVGAEPVALNDTGTEGCTVGELEVGTDVANVVGRMVDSKVADGGTDF